MKKSIFRLMPAGSGHYKVTIETAKGKLLSHTITDMQLIDDFKSDNDKLSQRAKRRLIWLVENNQ